MKKTVRRAALLALRDQHLIAENQRPDVLEAMARLEAAKRVALLWNMGKVIHTGVGD